MADPKVYIRPYFENPDKGEGGIRRWVEAQRSRLPDLGVQIVDAEDQADVVACHAGDIVDTRKPLVAHCHGLYHTGGEWARWEWIMNRQVIEILRRSTIATAPSQWVANQLARGMCLDARVLYAGVEPGEWEPGVDGHYVLWNKTRVDAICDPGPLNRLARMNPKQRFISTFGAKLDNVQLTGKLPFGEAKGLIQNAQVYLCTPRETFGIGTLEAMASAVPVLGWAWGGQLDIVEHQAMGYLATPGDWEELDFGLAECIKHRAEWGAAAREHVLNTFTWDKSMEHCASIYQEAARENRERPRVSVIVTVYDLEKYLPDCLNSILRQSSKDWECLITDDNSPGNCAEIVAEWAAKDSRFKYLKTPRNLYLAGARNYAIEQAQGRYVLPLDCDDMIGDRTLEALGDFLDKQPGYAIAYGSMAVIEPDGSSFVSGWPGQARWEFQMAHRNQLPYCSLYRRELWRRIGGYRERCTTAEDADFWCRALSYGFRAQKVSNYPTLVYRNRPESMSHTKADPDWTQWYAWARHSHDSNLPRFPSAPVPFAAIGEPANKISWPVETYDPPQVSVVIPVGPGHERLVIDALDSLVAQSMHKWEAIVVNDTGEPLALPGHAHARILETPKHKSGPAVARNLGIAAARAPYFLCLDADDYLLPEFLEHTLAAAKAHGGYVYTDWWQANEDGTSERKDAPDWEIMDLLQKGLQFTVTALVPKAAWREAGGFDPNSGGWEDWDLFFAMATHGVCGVHLPEPLFVYRYWSGQRREDGYAKAKSNASVLRRKWRAYTVKGGEKLMGCRGCGGGGGARAAVNGRTPALTQISQSEITKAKAEESGAIRIEYVGNAEGARTYRGLRSGQVYRFGAAPADKIKLVFAVDAPTFLRLPDFREVRPEPVAVPMAAPTGPVLDMRQAATRVGCASG